MAKSHSSKSYKTIQLTRGQVTIVDVDFDPGPQKWQAHWNSHTRSYYAKRTIWHRDGTRHGELLHRLVMGVTDRKIHVDHRSHDTLDNRRKNLRIADNGQNRRNGRLSRNNSSGCTGVSWNRPKRGEGRHRWIAVISIGGKPKYLGRSDSKEVAIAIRKAAEIKYYGKFRYKEEEDATRTSATTTRIA